MKSELRRSRIDTLGPCLALAFASFTSLASPVLAQRLPGTENGEWRYLGGDAGHTRSSPLDQINASNFANPEQAWLWRGDNLGPNRQYGMMTYMHEGRQYIVVQIGSIHTDFPGSLVAFRLP